jgi:hypothetical protein
MNEWLLIIVLTSGLWGDGMPISGITMHDFPSRELCESAASQAKEISGKHDTTFSHKCLKKDGGKWVDENRN